MFDENNPMPPGFKLIEGYNCPDCDRALTIWTNKRDGEQAKCRMCKKEHDITLLEKNQYLIPDDKRRSLKSLDSVHEGITRDGLLNIISNCESLMEQALIATLYITGGRVSEVVNYYNPYTKHKEHGLCRFNFEEGKYKGMRVFWIKGMKVLKMRGKEVYKGVPVSYKHDSEFIWYITEYLKTLDKKDPLFDIARQSAWNILNKYGLFPHLIRALRAIDLVQYYDMSIPEVVKFIGWKEYSTIQHYLKLSPLDLIKPGRY